MTTLDRLDAALTELDKLLETEAIVHDDDVDSNLSLLLELKDQQARLSAIVNEVERTAARQIPRRTYLGDRVKAEKTRSYADVWDVRRCAWDVIEPALINPATGELLCDEQTAWNLIDRLFGAASVKYYRAGALIALGLDPEEYRTREFRRYTVKVERVDTEDGAA